MCRSIRLRVVRRLFMPLLSITGCVATGSRSQLNDAVRPTSVADIPAVVCTAGDPVYFKLAALGELPSVVDAGIGPSLFYPSIENSWYLPNPDHNIRVGACLTDDDHLAVQQIVILRGIDGFSSDTLVVTPAAGATITGLEAAVFDGNYAGFSMMVPHVHNVSSTGTLTASSMAFIAGAVPGGHGLFAYQAELTDGVYRHLYPGVFAGRLETGDPVVSGGCPLSEAIVSSTAILGSATLKFKTCRSSLSTGTANHVFVEMAVIDPDRGVAWESTNGAELGEHLQVKINHHNGCDSFVLKIQGVRYAATAPASFGNQCGAILEGAPPRNAGDPAKLKYSIQDANGLVIGFNDCFHFTECPSH